MRGHINNLADLASLHSWLGIVVVVLFAQNYILGAIAFLMPRVNKEHKEKYFPFHKFLGIATLFAAAVAMTTGIHQQTGSYGCFYPRTGDNPATHYFDNPDGCRVSNGLGLLLLLNAILVAFAVWDFPTYNRAGGNY